MRLGIAAKAAGAGAHEAAPEDDEADRVVGERQAEKRAGDGEAADEEWRLGAAALADAPDEGRDQLGAAAGAHEAYKDIARYIDVVLQGLRPS